MNWARGLGLAAVPGVVIAVLVWGYPSSPAPLAFASRPCVSPTQFHVGHDVADPPLLRLQDGVWSFPTTAWLQAEVCGPGALTFAAWGTLTRGEGPHLLVSLNGVPLVDQFVLDRTSFRVTVPEAGSLTIAFPNDATERVVRTASITDMAFQGTDCEGMKAVSGEWQMGQHLVVLVENPLTLTPCGPGLLTFGVFGRSGEGAFPTVTVAQDGQMRQSVKTAAESQEIAVRVTSKPVTLTIVNPLNKLLEDRNLYVSDLSFSPTRTP